jgi:DNA-binding protein H-NS
LQIVADLLDQIARQKAQLLKEQREKEQAENRERQRKIKLARSLEALKTRQAILIGETIRDAELTPAELAAIGGILARRASKPKDWRVIAEWLLPTEEPANDRQTEADAVGPADTALLEIRPTGS